MLKSKMIRKYIIHWRNRFWRILKIKQIFQTIWLSRRFIYWFISNFRI